MRQRKSWLFEKINKTDKPISKLTKKWGTENSQQLTLIWLKDT